nr:zinc finger, CCHC-type [Tanacetum cinerariifolium]
MHFLLTTLKVVYVLTTLMPELLEDDTLKAIRCIAKWENNDNICKGHILNEDASSKKFLESDKGNGKEVVGPSVNMIEEGGKNKNNNQNKEKKRGFMDNNRVLVPTRNLNCNVERVAKLVTLRKIVVVETRRITQVLVVRERGLRTNPKTMVDAIVWWIDSGAITHVCKDRCWFKTYEPVEDGSVLYMGKEV